LLLRTLYEVKNMEFVLSKKRSGRIAALAVGVIVLAAMIIVSIVFKWPIYISAVIPALMAVATWFAVGVKVRVKNWFGMIILQLFLAFVGFFLLHFPSLNGIYTSKKAFLFNNLLAAAILFLFQAITGKIKPFGFIWMVFCLGYGIVNHAVYMFRGSIININDFGSIGTALSVAENYALEMHPSIAISAYLFVCATIVLARCRIKRSRIYRRSIRVLALFLAVVMAAAPLSFVKRIKPKLWRNRAAEHNGILMEYIAELRWLNIEAPEGYSHEAVAALLSKYNEETAPAAVSDADKPHIIAVMVEAYSDLNVLGDVGITEDVMANFNALKDESIHGYACASIFGGNTANSEWEFLTANSMAFLPGSTIPFRQYMKEKHNSLVDILTENGYECYAMHPFRPTGWDRHLVYPAVGFKESYFINDLEWGETVRGFTSDSAYVDQLIAQFEEKNGDAPLFLFGVTMQNHGDYFFENFNADVHVTGTKESYSNADQYVSLVKLTDAAIEKLISYFRNVDEKVQIVIFGDHQPNLKPAFYSDLGVKDEQTKRMIPFCIWNNYAPVSEEVPVTSINYLSAMLLESAGVPMPAYHQYLLDLQEKLPVVNSLGFVAADGTTGEPDATEGEYAALMNDYHILQYANMFDTTIDDSYFIGAAAE